MLTSRQILRGRIVAVVAGAILQASAFAGPASAEVVYREIFPNDGTVGRPASLEGWLLHSGATAVLQTTGNNITATPNDGKPTNATAVNSNPQNSSLVYGFPNFNSATTTNNPAIFWTNEVAGVNILTNNITSIDWYQGSQSADGTATGTSTANRVAVQVGGNWYASVLTFTNTGVDLSADFDANAEFKSLNLAAAQWHPLTFSPTSTLAINTGSTGSLPAGLLQAVGLFQQSTASANRTQRFDTFTINANAVPEPSSVVGFLLLGIVGAGVYAWRRRKTR